MTEEEYNKLVIKFSEYLKEKSLDFLLKSLDKNATTNTALNLMISAHISSLINLGTDISENSKEMQEFISKLITFLHENMPGGENKTKMNITYQ